MSPEVCKRCRAETDDLSVSGLCARCLMAANFISKTLPDTEIPEPAAPLSPEEISGYFPNYEILECLGRGGMGVVYKARQKTLDRLVAIKILADEWKEDSLFAKRFENEARTLALMSHPNIVTVHDFGDAEGLFYIAMEFIDGVNLRDLIEDGKMPPDDAFAIIPPICEALNYAHHKGIVHRDIKPENILLDNEGKIKLADFGVASLLGTEGEKAGTAPYMAPEQSKGQSDERTDIYSLGVVLYEMLTGERPTKDIVVPSHTVDVSNRIDNLVLRAMEKGPENRIQTALEFRTVAQEVISAESFSINHSASPHNLKVLQETSEKTSTAIESKAKKALIAAEYREMIELFSNLRKSSTQQKSRPGCFRFWWRLFIVLPLYMLTGGLLTTFLAYTIPPKNYQATSSVLFSPSKTEKNSDDLLISRFMKTSEAKEVSDHLELEPVVKELGLMKKWNITEREAVSVLRETIEINLAKQTDFIEIESTQASSELAIKTANSVLRTYVDTAKNSNLESQIEIQARSADRLLPKFPWFALIFGLVGGPILFLVFLPLVKFLINGSPSKIRRTPAIT